MNPENNAKKTILLIASIAIALFLIGGGIGAYIAINGEREEPESIELDLEIMPDVNAVPQDKPLPPAPKELVLKRMKYREIGQKELDRFDTDKDGKITRVEFRASWEKNFKDRDRNRDGRLDRKEWNRSAFRGMDLNKNRTLQLQEWLRFREWCFDTFYDADKDGVAVPGEWKK